MLHAAQLHATLDLPRGLVGTLRRALVVAAGFLRPEEVDRANAAAPEALELINLGIPYFFAGSQDNMTTRQKQKTEAKAATPDNSDAVAFTSVGAGRQGLLS